MKYIKQLDSLRALAIFTVIIVHWFPDGTPLYTFAFNCDAPTVFFTISGFLITAILLKERNRAEVQNGNKFILFKNFFFKRALRILPGYFLVVAIWYFFPRSNEPINFKYFLTFTSNIYIYQIKQWPALTHLWTMSVEEQFYLIWPWIILFINRKFLLYVILVIISISIISQVTTAPLNEFSMVLTTNCFGFLAIGALLSWVTIVKPEKLGFFYKILCYIATLSAIILFAQIVFHVSDYIKNHTLVVLMTVNKCRILISLITVWVIAFFVIRKDGKPYLLSFLLENKTLMNIGKISYGMYLYHLILPYYALHPTYIILNNFLYHTPSALVNTYITLAENFVTLLLVSVFSYKFFELPILQFKSYFKTPKVDVAPLIVK